MTLSVELVIDFDTEEKKKFFQKPFIKGSKALEGLKIGQEVEKKGDNFTDEDILKIASFVAKELYNDAFTAEQLIDGIHAPKMFETVMSQLGSVMGTDSGNASKAKKN